MIFQNCSILYKIRHTDENTKRNQRRSSGCSSRAQKKAKYTEPCHTDMAVMPVRLSIDMTLGIVQTICGILRTFASCMDFNAALAFSFHDWNEFM